MLRIIDNITEFKNALEIASDDIIGLVYKNVEVADSAYKKIEEVFNDENIGIVYSDIVVTTESDKYPHIYSSYKHNVYQYHPIILAPIFIRTNKEIKVNLDIEYLLAHCILKNYDREYFPYRIPEMLFDVTINKEQQEAISRDIQKINNNEHISNNN